MSVPKSEALGLLALCCLPAYLWAALGWPASAGRWLGPAWEWLSLPWALSSLLLCGYLQARRGRPAAQQLRAHDQALIEVQALNRLLQQAGHIARLGAWEYQLGLGIVYWSDVCFEIHGLDPDTPLPKDYLETFVPEVWQPIFRQQIERSLHSKSEWELELQILRGDGRLLWVRLRAESVFDEHEQIIAVRGVVQDIDDAKHAKERLQQSATDLDLIFEKVCQPMALLDAKTFCYNTVNSSWEQHFGHTRQQAQGHNALSLGLCNPSAFLELKALAERSPDGLHDHELQLQTAEGRALTVLQSMQRTRFSGCDYWLSTAYDITERKRQEESIRERETLLSLTLEAAALGRWHWDLQSGKISGDSFWRSLNALPPGEGPASMGHMPDALHWTQLLSPADMPRCAAQLRRHIAAPDREPFDMVWRIQPLNGPARWLRSIGKVVALDPQGQALRMLGVSLDVTDQQEQKNDLQQLAHFDPLTGLGNRLELAARLQDSLLWTREHGGLLGVVYIDLDGFKPVNDRLGHTAGDELLVIVAKRLQHALRSHDCVARLGGDEFVLLLGQLKTREQCEVLLGRIMHSVCRPYTLGTETVQITASMGYSLYPDDESDADALVRHADQAMYQAKQTGRNRVHAFDAQLERLLREQQAQSLRIREGLEAGEFKLYLQPKVDIRFDRVIGAEALARWERWEHPERGLLNPAQFLPAIEGTETEIQFGQWALTTALQMMDELQQQGQRLSIAVNISARHLQHPGFAAWVLELLASYPHLSPCLLDLEITESAALYDIAHVGQILGRLRKIGVRVSLDDFGTGYSSLTYLRNLPLDTLKIDRSFVSNMMRDAGDLAIVQGVVGLARSFGYSVVPEGVETQAQCDLLSRLGCHLAQGYFFAKPMPLELWPQWLRQRQSMAATQPRPALMLRDESAKRQPRS